MSFWFYRSSKTKTFKLVWHQLIATTSRSVKFTPLELGRLCLVQLDWQGAWQIVLNIAVSPVSPPGVNCTGEPFIDKAVASLTRRWTSVSSESARFLQTHILEHLHLLVLLNSLQMSTWLLHTKMYKKWGKL